MRKTVSYLQQKLENMRKKEAFKLIYQQAMKERSEDIDDAGIPPEILNLFNNLRDNTDAITDDGSNNINDNDVLD